MRDLQHSLNLNFSMLNSVNWRSINEQPSQDGSTNRLPNQYSNFLFTMPNQPPRPTNSLYSCIDSDSSPEEHIKQVAYLPNETQQKMVRQVNQKQYFRIMKRRVKKGLQQLSQNERESGESRRKKYMHESRHKHAITRARGKDGKFLPTRPAEERFREKKKRGRKPKAKPEAPSPKNQSTGLKELSQ